MKYTGILLLGWPAAFVAGWWWGPGLMEAVPANSGRPAPARNVVTAGTQIPAAAKPSSPLGGPAPILIKPLTSLKDAMRSHQVIFAADRSAGLGGVPVPVTEIPWVGGR